MSSPRSKEKLVLVKHDPLRRPRALVYGVLCLVVTFVVGFVIGWERVKAEYDSAQTELENIQLDFADVQQNESVLRQRVAVLERGRAIDEQAKADIQATIKDLKSQVSQLSDDVTFYKNIMAPSADNKGLQVQKLELEPGREERQYSYKLVLTQVVNNKSYVSGVVAVNFIGQRNGKEEILPLRDISEVKDLGIKFRFRYFQDIKGALTLPEGFTPEKIQVVAQSKGKRPARAEQTFDWNF